MGAGRSLGRVLVTNKGRISNGKNYGEGRRERGGRKSLDGYVRAQKGTGMKGKYSLTATINPYRKKKEEGGRKSGEWDGRREWTGKMGSEWLTDACDLLDETKQGPGQDSRQEYRKETFLQKELPNEARSMRKSLYWKIQWGLQWLLQDYGGIYNGILPPDFQIRDLLVAAGCHSQPQTCLPSQDRFLISKGRKMAHPVVRHGTSAPTSDPDLSLQVSLIKIVIRRSVGKLINRWMGLASQVLAKIQVLIMDPGHTSTQMINSRLHVLYNINVHILCTI